MKTTRREILQRAGAAWGGAALACLPARLVAADASADRPRIGVCDWSLGLAAQTTALDKAKALGLEGVQVSPRLVGDRLSFADAAQQKAYGEAARRTGMQVASVGLALTNSFPLASDPRGPAWLEQAIDSAAALGCRTVLLAFFGKGDLLDGKKLKTRDVDEVVRRLKAAVPRAGDKGVVLGLESWLSAQDTLDILERVGGEAMAMYYDVVNSTLRGYDVPAEIRRLKGRICEIHFKDNKGPLGKGDVNIEAACEAIREIGYKGWIILEGHYGDRDACMRANAATARKLLNIS